MRYYLQDCCLEVSIDAEPVLILNEGDVDPFDDDEECGEVMWPAPRVYWSNGVITNGAYSPDKE